MYFLGISAFCYDSAVCLIKDAEIVAASQEERFTKKKHDANFPSESIKYWICQADISSPDLTNVVFHEKPLL